MSEEMKFENALAQLEKIAEKLESGDISLDESVALFEEGIKLSDFCSKKLKEAEQKIISISDAEKEDEV